MPSLEVLTINESEKHSSGEDLLEIMWRALEYFPRGIWESINYLGDARMKYDVKIRSMGNIYNAFLFSNLIDKIRKIKRTLQIKDLLLAVTRDPVITLYHRFEDERIRQIANLVYDYVSSDVGILSFFRVTEEKAPKIIAHGLGHNRGLRHHVEPIDVMYEGLIEHNNLRNNGFCDSCIRRMLDRE